MAGGWTVSFYAGPDKPRFRASDWAELKIAASAGVFDETAWVELKKDVPATSPQANLELARDLASLSVDGGTLLIGVTDSTKDVVGIADVSAVRDRVIQVAHGRITPPLFIDPVSVPDPDDPTSSVLVISVPASASAPHMVDDRYWGRSAQGKRTLSDSEVARLFAARAQRLATLESDLHRLSMLDPHLTDARRHGHLYALIRPATPPRTRLSEVVKDRDATTYVWGAVHAGDFRPSLPPMRSGVSYVLPHPDGYLLASSTSEAAEEEQNSLRVFLGDSGTVACVYGGGTRPYGQDVDAPEAVFPAHLFELVHGLVNLAGDIGANILRIGESGRPLSLRIGSRASSRRSITASPPFRTFTRTRMSTTTARPRRPHAR
jgi:hypothetical protein